MVFSSGRRRGLVRRPPRLQQAAHRPQGLHQRRPLQELDPLGHHELLGRGVCIILLPYLRDLAELGSPKILTVCECDKIEIIFIVACRHHHAHFHTFRIERVALCFDKCTLCIPN